MLSSKYDIIYSIDKLTRLQLVAGSSGARVHTVVGAFRR